MFYGLVEIAGISKSSLLSSSRLVEKRMESHIVYGVALEMAESQGPKILVIPEGSPNRDWKMPGSRSSRSPAEIQGTGIYRKPQ